MICKWLLKSGSVACLSLAEQSLTSCPMWSLVLWLSKQFRIDWAIENRIRKKGNQEKEKRQVLTELESIFGSAEGIDETVEGGDGSVNFEYSTNQRLRLRPPLLRRNILEAHLVLDWYANQKGKEGRNFVSILNQQNLCLCFAFFPISRIFCVT